MKRFAIVYKQRVVRVIMCHGQTARNVKYICGLLRHSLYPR